MILVLFSTDQPLQSDAALCSFQRHCRDATVASVKVFYKAATSRMLSLYRRLGQEHPEADFVREGDFKRDLLLLLRDSDYVLFLANDTVFVRDFSIQAIADTLNQNGDAIGYSLRMDRPQKAPAFEALVVYRSQQILPLLEKTEFTNSKSLENALSRHAARFRQGHPVLLRAGQSLAFSIPSPVGSLAELFAQGQRINVEYFDRFTPEACGQAVEFKLAASAAPVPLVSVVIPCYKQALYLPEAVASVAAQTFADWEIIIVNDGSPDETGAVARQLIGQYAGRRIRLLETRNEGLARARNAGIRAAAGAYVLPLDADDKIEPAMLAKTVALLEAEPGIAIAYTDVAHFGAVSKVIQAAEYDFHKICQNNQLNYCSLYRHEVWETAGPYNSNMIWGYEDWEFWIGSGEHGFVARRIPGAFLQYRVKDSSMYTEAVDHDKDLRARIILNHPALYDSQSVREARTIWSQRPRPAPPGAPMVSVIIPTYNRPGRLADALRSVLDQTLQDFEIIVVNDNGLDVRHVIDRLNTRRKIVYLPLTVKKGISHVRNRGLRMARGKYIVHLDDDDVFLPDHLETLAGFLEKTGHKAAYTDAYRAEEKMEGGRTVVHRAVQYSSDWDNDRIVVSNFVPTLCFMHERAAGVEAGEFDESLTTHEDWDFWIRLSRVCQPVHIKKVTCEFRVIGDGFSVTSHLRRDFLRTAKVIHRRYDALAADKKHVQLAREQVLRVLRAELGVEEDWLEVLLRWWRLWRCRNNRG